MKRVACLAFALLLASCGSEPTGSNVNAGADSKAAPQAEEESKEAALVNSVDQAMTEIPPQDRRNFHKALACEVKRKEGKGIEITPEYIRGLYAALKQNPTMAEC